MTINFSGKRISLIFLGGAIFCKTILTHIFFIPGVDRILQALAGKSLVEGHGISLPGVHAGDLSKEIWEPLIGWPPGYSILTGFVDLFFKNILFSCFAIEVLSIFAFLLSLERILRLLDFPSRLINLLIVFNGLAIPAYTESSSPTDLPAMAACLWSCYFLLEFVMDQRKEAAWGIGIGLVNTLATFFRYAYWPVSGVIPFFLIWNGIYKKDRRLLGAGFISLSITGILAFCLILLQPHYAGGYSQTKPLSLHRVFFSNLQYLSPFIFSSFLNLPFYLAELPRIGFLSVGTLQKALMGINVVLIFVFLFIFQRYAVVTRLLARRKEDVFFMSGALISLMTFALLCFLSLTTPLNSGPPREMNWTYILETRYFAIICTFLQIFFSWWLFVDKIRKGKRSDRLVKGIFIGIIFVEMAHGIFIIGKYTTRCPTIVVDQDRLLKKMEQIFAEKRKNDVGVVFASAEPEIEGLSLLLGGKNLSDVEELNGPVIASVKPVWLIVALEEKENAYFRNFLTRKGVICLSQSSNMRFYSYYVEPGIIR